MKAIRIITLFMASAAVAAITSCAKEETSTPEQEQFSIIKADIVKPTDEGATKTSLGSLSGGTYPVLWKSLDAIAVSGKSATEYATYTTNDNTQSGTFTLSSGTAPKGEVYAYHPAGNVTGVSSATYTVSFPATQSYAENSFGNGAFPMYASATTLEGGLTFQSLMSVLKLQLTSSDSKYVRRIVVTSDTENLSGTAQINMSNGAITWTSGNKSVELDCGEGGVQLTSTFKTFHIAVPAGASKNYCVVITTTDAGKGVGKNLTSKTFTVGKIKKMPEVGVSSSTASKPIYAEGSYMGDGIAITTSVGTKVWAPVNCGYDATNAPTGLFYQWGRKYGQSNTKGMTDADFITTQAESMAAGNTEANKDKFYKGSLCWYKGNTTSDTWLSEYGPCPAGWRVPNETELSAIKDANKEWTSEGGPSSDQTGYKFGTSPNQVFFPVVGCRSRSDGSIIYATTDGFYWSSSPSTDDADDARYLHFGSGDAKMLSYDRADGYSVRCVQE